MKRQMWIDTDTASDDAVALIIALRHPDIEVRGISVVAGNVPLEMGVQNALYTAELCASTVPIYVGAAQPLVRTLRHGAICARSRRHGRHWLATIWQGADTGRRH